MKPSQLILDRELAAADMKHFTAQLAALEDLADYGSGLVLRAFRSSERKLEDVVIILSLLKQAVAMVDAAHVLLSQGAVYAAGLPTRSLLEASLSLEWTLKQDTTNRAKAYFVANVRREKLFAARAIPGTHENDKLTTSYAKGGLTTPTFDPAKVAECQESVAAIEHVLCTAEFAATNAAFDAEAKKRDYEPAWIIVAGARSLHAIAKDVDRAMEYMIFYSTLSESAHGASYKGHVALDGREVLIHGIRSPEGIDTILRYLMATAVGVYRMILARYREGELDRFGREYVARWRKPMNDMPTVTVTPAIQRLNT